MLEIFFLSFAPCVYCCVRIPRYIRTCVSVQKRFLSLFVRTGHLFVANGEKTNSPVSERCCCCSHDYGAYPPENRNCLGSAWDNGGGGDVVGGGFRRGRRSSCARYTRYVVYVYTSTCLFYLGEGELYREA